MSARHPRTFSPTSSSYESFRAQELCEGRDGRPGLPVPNSHYSLCGHKATLEEEEGIIIMIT